MPRPSAFWLCLWIALPAIAAEEGVTRLDVAYSDVGGDRTRLDIYSPPKGSEHRIVLWIHGGAWRLGNKAQVQAKPKWFNEHGYVFVSIDYRLHPAVSYKEQAGDIAKAIAWIHTHSAEFGGDSKRLFLMGHSAGAHLAALVATDERYLKAEGLALKDLSGIVLLDGAGYDIPLQIKHAPFPRMKTLYTSVFGEDKSTQRDASPISHVAQGKGIPPFLILHVASRLDSMAQSRGLAKKLVEVGGKAKVIPAEGKTHMTINRELGQSGDPSTQAVYEFLQERGAALRK